MPPSGRGVIYAAIRERFVDEARISARSVRRFLPSARIVLFTDLQLERSEPFDQVIRLTSLSAKPHLDKLNCMKNSPFAETLFLDTDTYVCGELSDLFELLAQFDIAMTLDRRYYDDFPPKVGVPYCVTFLVYHADWGCRARPCRSRGSRAGGGSGRGRAPA
jgi:hypothetical protein